MPISYPRPAPESAISKMRPVPNDNRLPAVAAIIVSWNSGAWLQACLDALLAQTYPHISIVIWDNASDAPTSATLDRIESEYCSVRVERSERNLGFAGGNNAAAGLLPDAGFILTVNPDAILAPDCVQLLVEAAQRHPQCGAFGVTQLLPDGSRYDGVGDCYSPTGIAWRGRHGEPVRDLDEAPREIIAPCAAVALYRRSAFDACGGFDADFFCYVEDVDLGLRLQLMGMRSLHVPAARALHAGGSTTGQRSDFASYHGHRNMVWAYCKNMPGPLFWLFLPLHLAANLMSILVLTARGQGAVAWRAKLDALRGLPRMLRKRRVIQRTRAISAFDLIPRLTFRMRTPRLFASRK